MDAQTFIVNGERYDAQDPQLQIALASVHEGAERPRCMCQPGGVEMYVARHRQYVIKRMPGTGAQHHPQCASFELDAQQCGLGELLGEAIIEEPSGNLELRVGFPWARVAGRSVARVAEPNETDVDAPPHRLSLRALTHLLFDRAGFNRWTPAMAGKRHQGVVCRHLLEAAADMTVRGRPLAERLYVPDAFHEATKTVACQRRRDKLSVLQHSAGGQVPLALVLGEFKTCEAIVGGRRLWIKHMPDSPLLIPESLWGRARRRYASFFDVRDGAADRRPRLVVTALIRSRYENVYEVDTLSVMLTTVDWIPIEGAHEIELIHALIDQRRRFIKPLRYDAKSSMAFATALLTDVNNAPAELYVLSAFLDEKERAHRGRALAQRPAPPWVWSTDQPMPALPRSSVESTPAQR